MPSTNAEAAKNDKARQPSEHAKPTSQDIPGVGKRGGAARDAGRSIESRSRRNRSALDIARKSMR